jgi:hypothetical protein
MDSYTAWMDALEQQSTSSGILELTDPDGRTVWIVQQWVTKVSYPPTGQWSPNAKSLIWMGANTQAVREEPETVIKLLLDGGVNDDA